MATPIFPTGRFGFITKEVDIERQTLKGGTALSGEQDTVSTDGGGRVFAEFSGGQVVDRDRILGWRALLTLLEEGVTRVVVPFCDVRHTPYNAGRRGVPHSDGTPFDDETLYAPAGPSATTVGAAALRDTSILFTGVLPQPLIGGEWFSIEHENKGWRAYRIRTIEPDGTVTFRPPLREAVPTDTYVELNAPRCLMVQDGRASSKTDFGRYTEAAIRFVEAP